MDETAMGTVKGLHLAAGPNVSLLPASVKTLLAIIQVHPRSAHVAPLHLWLAANLLI
jgi:hypothetical protein